MYLCNMVSSVVEYIEGLMVSRGMNQSQLARALFVSRQQVSYLMSGQRELTLDMAIRIETLFCLKEGVLMSMQAKERTARRRAEMRSGLVEKLKGVKAFWSYEEVDGDSISDDDVIEATIIHLDMEEIEQLFALYGPSRVKSVWRERIAVQGEHMRGLNVMMAMYFFGIKRPERYLDRIEDEYFRKLMAYA